MPSMFKTEILPEWSRLECCDSSVSMLVLLAVVMVLAELLLLSVRRKVYAFGMLLLWTPSIVRFFREFILLLLETETESEEP